MTGNACRYTTAPVVLFNPACEMAELVVELECELERISVICISGSCAREVFRARAKLHQV